MAAQRAVCIALSWRFLSPHSHGVFGVLGRASAAMAIRAKPTRQLILTLRFVTVYENDRALGCTGQSQISPA